MQVTVLGGKARAADSMGKQSLRTIRRKLKKSLFSCWRKFVYFQTSSSEQQKLKQTHRMKNIFFIYAMWIRSFKRLDTFLCPYHPFTWCNFRIIYICYNFFSSWIYIDIILKINISANNNHLKWFLNRKIIWKGISFLNEKCCKPRKNVWAINVATILTNEISHWWDTYSSTQLTYIIRKVNSFFSNTFPICPDDVDNL